MPCKGYYAVRVAICPARQPGLTRMPRDHFREVKGRLKSHGVERLSVTAMVPSAIEKAIGFVRRQKHNYRVAITRSASNGFLLNLTAQYDSIHTVALGADSVESGTINSIGNGISALISMRVGWLMDRYGLKPFYLLGMGLLAGV